jgi:hypothetical protein
MTYRLPAETAPFFRPLHIYVGNRCYTPTVLRHPTSIPVLLAAGAALAWLGNALAWAVLAVYIPVSFLVWMFLRMMRSQIRQSSRTFEIVTEEDRIKQDGFLPLTLLRSEITEISEGPGGLAIKSTSDNAIFVPFELIGFHELRQQLAEWLPIKVPTPPAPVRHAAIKQDHRDSVAVMLPILYLDVLIARSPALVHSVAALVIIVACLFPTTRKSPLLIVALLLLAARAAFA